jgi:hypothetical protein
MHDPYQTYPQLGNPLGMSPYGIPYATNPYAAGLHNPLLQNPILQNPVLQNPLLQYALWQQSLSQQNPFIQQNPMLHALQQQPFGHQGLAPQSFLGAGLGAGQFGTPGIGQQQIHPLILQQLALRSLATPGITPWAGF